MEGRRLTKTKDRKICGVCGGVAKYFNMDATIIRLIWLCSILCCGVGLLAYFITAIIMPNETD